MMNLVRWNPLSETRALQNRVSRFFDNDFFPTPWFDNEMTMADWKPAVDIYDNDDSIVIKAELPGVESKNVSVELKDRVLTLKGERSHEKEVKEENYHRKERSFGKFQRSFALPAEVNADNIKADYKDGILNIEIPKPEKKKPKKITVH